MVLQTTGQICLDDLATEFGGVAPHCLSEYYRGGGLVPDTPTNSGIPTSGQVCLDDFYGGDVVSGPAQGELYTWGMSKYGQAGTGVNANYTAPTQESLLSKTDWIFAFGGGNNIQGGSFFIDSTNACYASGWTKSANQPSADYQTLNQNGGTPTNITTFQNYGAGFASMKWMQQGGLGITTAGIKTDGTLWFLGTPQALPTNDPIGSTNFYSSLTQEYSSATNWDSVCSGAFNMCALTTSGNLYYAGSHYEAYDPSGQSTSGTAQVKSTTWVQPPNASNVIGYNFGEVGRGITWLKSDGKIHGSGNVGNAGQQGYFSNYFYGTGEAQYGSTTTFSNIGGLMGDQSGGGGVSKNIYGFAAIGTDGKLWAAGMHTFNVAGQSDAYNNQLNSNTNANQPVQESSGATNWDQVATSHWAQGSSLASAVKTDGRLWSWGSIYAQVGTYSWSTGQTALVQEPSSRSDWVWTSCGGTVQHALLG
jgi:hypothetical protein